MASMSILTIEPAHQLSEFRQYTRIEMQHIKQLNHFILKLKILMFNLY